VQAKVTAEAAELLRALERDRAKARGTLRKRIEACREAVADVEHFEAVAAWLYGAAEGRCGRSWAGAR
jgi:hypothetical protein